MASKSEPDGDRKFPDPSGSTRRHDHQNSDGVKQCLQPGLHHEPGHNSKPGPGGPGPGGAERDKLDAECQKQAAAFYSKSTSGGGGGRRRPSDGAGQTSSTSGGEDEREAKEARREAEEARREAEEARREAEEARKEAKEAKEARKEAEEARKEAEEARKEAEARREAEEAHWRKESEAAGPSRPGNSEGPAGGGAEAGMPDRPRQTSGGGSRRQSETEGSDWSSGGGAGHSDWSSGGGAGHSDWTSENIKPTTSSSESLKAAPKLRGEPTCCRLDELRRLPQCTTAHKPLDFGPGHAVLVDVNVFRSGGGLRPQVGTDVWRRDCVKMPCSPHSIMMYESSFPKTPKKVRRWDVIHKTLSGLSKKPTVTVKSLEEAIMKYNPKYKGQWSFGALSSFVELVPPAENYFQSLFPKMAALALELPAFVRTRIPLLQTGHAASVTLSQMQIACLLANAFFCTFPHRNTTAANAEYHRYPSINFSSLFGNPSPRVREKLRALMHYFQQVTDAGTKPTGLVTFERRLLADTSASGWKRCKETMPKLHVTSRGTIETEGEGMLQVDFASSWIGGGVLGAGLVQEEILFLINPELIVSRLFTEKLADDECLIITGVQQFSRYSGFSDGFEWAGHHDDRVDRDHWARRQRQILAIDAQHYKQRRSQYNMKAVTRELNKAFCGFKGSENEPDIATGKWGCGAFNGDAQLKAVIQLMAAARARRGLAFFTFEDENLRDGLQRLHQLLVTERTTVGRLLDLLGDFCSFVQNNAPISLFDFIYSKLASVRSPL